MGKWSKFEQESQTDEASEKKDESKDTAKDRPEKDASRSVGSTDSTASADSTGPTKAAKDKVVQDMVDLRDSVSGVLANARGKLPAERIQDLEDAQGTIDGAVGKISPKDALANQQEQTQSLGMGMGGSSRDDDED